mmetsp:Transcript_35098/g.83826  ORF Transcript_35098/g.83826 Transcript_35098/m.83826 type:complete len:104 (+) Transcript_35098:460-771(+)
MTRPFVLPSFLLAEVVIYENAPVGLVLQLSEARLRHYVYVPHPREEAEEVVAELAMQFCVSGGEAIMLMEMLSLVCRRAELQICLALPFMRSICCGVNIRSGM